MAILKGKKIYKLLILCLLFVVQAANAGAQDISGMWQGQFRTDQRLNGRSETFFMSMVLNLRGRKIQGQFYTAPLDFPKNQSVIYEISGLADKKEKLPRQMMRDRILYSRIPDEVAEYFLSFEEIRYVKNDTVEMLYGNWRANGLVSLRSDGYAGSFWVSRPVIKQRAPADSTTLPLIKTMAELPMPVAAQMAARENATQGNITVNSKRITIQLYDNGVDDGDTVSVFFNGKLLLSHQRISEKPVTLEVDLDEKLGKNELILFAENLGSIAPNTALIIVSAGNNRYELFSSADLLKNALLTIQYQQKE